MAGRVNTKFVVIVSAVVVVLVGGLVLVAQRLSRDAQEFVARGEQYLAEGKYEEAVETFQRAVNRSESDPQVIRKYVDAVQQKPAADHVEATNALQLARQWTLNIAQINPDSEQTLKDYADLIEMFIERTRTGGGQHPFVQYTYQAALARLEYNAQDELARRYRAVYGLLFLNSEQADDDINRVHDDIQWAYDTFPGDAEVAYGLARWKLFDAGREDRPGGDAARAKQLRDEAVALMQGLVDAEPENTNRKLEHLQVLYQATRTPGVEEDDPYAAIKPQLDALERQLLDHPEPFEVVSTAAQFIKTVYADDLAAEDDDVALAGVENPNVGVRRAVALLRRAIEKHPQDPRYKLMLGNELKLVNEFDQAKTYLEEIKGLSTQGNYLDVLLNYTLKSSAEIEYADLLISLAEQGATDEARRAMHAEAGKIVDRMIATGRGEEPRILLLKGRLALAQNKTREGLLSIDKAADAYDAFSREKAEAILLSARARAQQGDWGSAAERYEQILKVNPKVPAVRLTLAGIYIRQRDFVKAQDHLDAILIDDPTHERAITTQASLYAAQGDIDKAIQTYRGLDLPNRPDLAQGLAQLMIQGDRKDQAVSMLKHYFDAAPTNLGILASLLSAEDSPDARMRLIEASRAAGGDAETLDRLTRQLDAAATGDVDKTIENLIGDVTDPFLRAINRARLLAQAGENEKARAELKVAEGIKPDDKSVIDMKFAYALQDGDLALAQKLADKAVQLNLDEASGKFYQAQVQAKKQDHAAAIASLRAGLAEVPINSEGWRMLGDMHVAISNDQDAVTAYETALRQKPDNLGAMRGLAAIRDRQGRHDEALGMLRLAQKQYPAHTGLRELYLGYEGRYGDKQAALKQRRELMEKQPQNTDNERALAMLMAETGQTDAAIQIIQGLIDKQGQTPPNVVALASVYSAADDSVRGTQVIKNYIASLGTDVKASDHLLLARYLFQSGDGPGALTAYQQAIAAESPQREATRELAALYFSRGSYDRAVPLYRELHTTFPDEDAVGLRLADAMIRTEQFEDAAKVLDGVEGGATEDALRALVAESRGDNAEAVRLVNRAIEAEPGRAVFHYERAALKSADPKLNAEVIQDLNTALGLDPDHLLSRRLLVGMYQRQGERREALRELNTMVTRHPAYNEGRMNLIRVLVQDGDMTRAKSLARAGLEQSKDDDPTWHAVLGDLALRENDTAAAIASFKKVFELSPNPGQLLKLTTIQIENGKAADAQALLREHADLVNPQPMLQAVMGRALYATGKTDEAAQVFARSAERCTSLDQFFAVASQVRQDYTLDETASLLQGLSQQPSRAWLDLTLARLEMTDGRTDSVIDRLKALEPTLGAQDTAERQALDQVMAPALHQAGRASEALVYYQRLIEAMPKNASVLNNMAYLLGEDLNRPAEALPLAQRAVEVEPKNAQVLDTLGWVQFKLGQIDDARRSLEASIAEEDLGANHLHLAELLIKQGYRAEANRHLQTAIDLAEQSKETQVLQRARELLEQSEELTEAAVTP